MTWPGSFEERGAKAAGDALAFGATRLTAQFIGVVASFGATCFLKDREVANTIIQRNGRKPHPRSVARVRRQARELGLVEYRRIMSGQTPPGARYPTNGGTTAKTVDFSAFGSRDPLTRGQKRRIRRRQQSLDGRAACVSEPADLTPSVTPPPDRPRHTTPPPNGPELYARTPQDPVLAAAIAQATAMHEAKWQRDRDRDDLRMMRQVVRETKPPPKPPD